MHSRRSVALSAALLVVPAGLAAQASGALSGHIRDGGTGHGIPNAIVTVEGGRRGATTDTSGAYRIRELRRCGASGSGRCSGTAS